MTQERTLTLTLSLDEFGLDISVLDNESGLRKDITHKNRHANEVALALYEEITSWAMVMLDEREDDEDIG